jgi:glycosyltransferase involved in cell wall biosynthesis
VTTTPVHLLHSSPLIGGGNTVLLRLIDGLDRQRFEPRSIVPDEGPLARALAARGVPACRLDLARATGLARLARLGRFSIYLRRHGRALVHANDPHTYGMSRPCLSPRSSRWICHVHHPDADTRTLTWAFRLAPVRVLTPSRYVATLVERSLPDRLAAVRDRIRTVMNPIDTAFFSPTRERDALMSRLDCRPGALHLVTAGAITPHKGQDLFVRVVKTLRDRGLDVEGHVIGGIQPGQEQYDASVHALTAELGLTSHMRFHGFASNEDVRDWFRIAEVFLLPTSEEGFGLVLAEAQACGTPVVSTRIPPLDEVVLHERTGLLVPRTVDEMAEAAERLLRAPGQRRAMGDAGRAWVVSAFAANAFCDRVMSVYDEALAPQTSGTERR